MSNLYYTYRGENAGQRSSTAPSHLPSSSDSLQLHQGVPISSSTQPSISFSNHQAWAPDQPTALQNHPQNQSHPSVNASFHTSLHPPQPSLPMNATRPPIASRQTQYDDNLFQIMGKPFTENPSRNQPASSPPSDQYTQLRPSQPSNVFDPNEFPSLAGAVQNSPSVQQSHPTPSLLSTSNPSDPTPLGNLPISAAAINGLAHYTDLYSLGPYGDGRGKAVDALTGASAAAEFNMQSEDFPALGGPPRTAPPTNPTTSLAPTPAPVTSAPSIGNIAPIDSLFDRQPSSAPSSQPQALLARAQIPTSMLMPRSSHIANGYQLAESPPTSSVLSLDRPTQPPTLHQQRNVDDVLPSASPSRTPFPLPSQTRGNTTLADSARRPVEIDAQPRKEVPRSRHTPVTNASRMLPNGQNNTSRTSLLNGPAAKAQANTSLLSRLGGSGLDDPQKTSTPSLAAADKYGMKALLPIVLPLSEGNGKVENMLAVGLDLTALGLNLNSSEPLHKTFDNPWDGGQAGSGSADNTGSSPKSQEPQYKLPTCYYMQPPALRSSHFTKFQLETLFYIFYNMPRDVLQLLAAVELYSRKWRYHKDLKLWFTCDPEANGSYDNRGYIYFDIKSWERRQFHEANQSFIQGLMTEDELNSVKIPPL